MGPIILLIEQFLAPIIAAEVNVLIAGVETKAPALLKMLLDSILAIPEVQDKIKELETGGVDAVLRFLVHEAEQFGRFISDYVKKKIAELNAPPAKLPTSTLGYVSLAAYRKIAIMTSSDIDRALGV